MIARPREINNHIESNLIVINKPIKILVATPLGVSDIGSSATYTRFLKEMLPAVTKDKVRVITLGWKEVGRWPRGLSHVLFFLKALNRGRFCDIIYTLDTVNAGWPAWLAARILRKPFVVKFSKDYVWEQAVSGEDDNETYLSVLAKIQNFVIGKADHLIVPSLVLRDYLVKGGVTEKNIAVLPDAFEELKEIGAKESLRKKMRIVGNVIVGVGPLDVLHGFEALIEMMPLVLEKFPEAKLLIIGDGPRREFLQDLIEERGLEDNIYLTGQIEKRLLYTYLKIADVFVSNDRRPGISHALIEALSLGVPVVVADAAGNREIIEDKMDGLLVARGNESTLVSAITKVLEGGMFADILAGNARNKSSRFDSEKAAKQFITFITKIR